VSDFKNVILIMTSNIGTKEANVMGFVQSFVYAEIAGLYLHKSGGASVYGAAAFSAKSAGSSPANQNGTPHRQ
ncbi:MAG TPA: hypothetical protein EYP08_03610, partial [Pyrodictiaceae archaeon]|nr:hypothetical protein [Pyrodictiaceae archaeon]